MTKLNICKTSTVRPFQNICKFIISCHLIEILVHPEKIQKWDELLGRHPDCIRIGVGSGMMARIENGQFPLGLSIYFSLALL